jgi:predicted metal-dependent hydrolase
MPVTWNTMWSSGHSEVSATLEKRQPFPVPLEIKAIRNARRLRLRFDERRTVLKLTCPAHYSRSKALAWAAEQRTWVEAQIARAGQPEPLIDGALIPLEGSEVRLRWEPKAARAPLLQHGVIIAGGPPESFGPRIERFLKKHALETLSRDAEEFASKAGVAIRGISVGDAESRWGSCSSQGRIRFNWRLILAPPAARRFVAAHEVAHLVHLNHGPEFKALEAALFDGDPAAARALLRRVGPRLKRVVGRL